MKSMLLLVFLWLLVGVCTCSSSTEAPTTTPHPEHIKLQQLKLMEESSLTGWYAMVNKFLAVIKPHPSTLDHIINFIAAKHSLDPQTFVIKIAQQNSAFLGLVVIGLSYAVAMIVTGLCFFGCRLCGRCGAKDSQKQRRRDNCWRTIHKFCLILMLAFLVVPIVCICLINVHMSESSPYVKGNISQVFDILNKFADKTDEDVDKASRQSNENPIQNFEAFKNSFIQLVEGDISKSMDYTKLAEIKDIVSWIASVEHEEAAMSNASDVSRAVENLKTSIQNIRHSTRNIYNCSHSDKKICQLQFRPLPLEEINVEKEYSNVQEEFKKLLEINFKELTNVIEQIQNNTFIRNKIEEESESLRRFVSENMYGDREVWVKVKKKIKYYTDKLRKFTENGKKEVNQVFVKSDEFEIYRYWGMYGVAGILLVPVLLLTLGMMCGCSGYNKERHPTKRSTKSHCGGGCLILAVYYFFLVSSFLMLLTIGDFTLGGSLQTFVCTPLYQSGFSTLDEMKDKLTTTFYNTSDFVNKIKPSHLLRTCHQDKSIIYGVGFIKENDTSSIEELLEESEVVSSDSTVEDKLKKALLDITSRLRVRLRQFTSALNLRELKDIPAKLTDYLRASRANISHFAAQVDEALNEDLGPEIMKDLTIVNDSVSSLFLEMDRLQAKLNGFQDSLLNIYTEADRYKDKIRDIENSLDNIENKLPKVIKSQLFYAVASLNGYNVDNIGKCYEVWLAYDISRVAVCEFIVYPLNGFWFALGWALVIVLPTLLFSVKLSRFYLRMKYDDDSYLPDYGEAVPLEDMSRAKPFSYTNTGSANWMPQFGPHPNYMVHHSQSRHYHYK